MSWPGFEELAAAIDQLLARRGGSLARDRFGSDPVRSSWEASRGATERYVRVTPAEPHVWATLYGEYTDGAGHDSRSMGGRAYVLSLIESFLVDWQPAEGALNPYHAWFTADVPRQWKDSVEQVIAALEGAGVRHVVGGGPAALIYGEAVDPGEVAILVAPGDELGDAAIGALARLGFHPNGETLQSDRHPRVEISLILDLPDFDGIHQRAHLASLLTTTVKLVSREDRSARSGPEPLEPKFRGSRIGG